MLVFVERVALFSPHVRSEICCLGKNGLLPCIDSGIYDEKEDSVNN
jgi:hypothetical protein